MVETPKKLIWIRLPESVYTEFVGQATRANLAYSEAVEFLIRRSGPGMDIVVGLEDTPDPLSKKLGVRIAHGYVATLEALCRLNQLPVSVYIRKLLYHFLVTKKIWFVQKDDHYTLAFRPHST